MADLLFLSQKEIKDHKEIKKINYWTEEEDKLLKEKAKEFNYKIGIQLQNLSQEKMRFNALQDIGVLDLD